MRTYLREAYLSCNEFFPKSVDCGNLRLLRVEDYLLSSLKP